MNRNNKKKKKFYSKIDTMENKSWEIGNIDVSKNSYNKYRRCTDIKQLCSEYKWNIDRIFDYFKLEITFEKKCIISPNVCWTNFCWNCYRLLRIRQINIGDNFCYWHINPKSDCTYKNWLFISNDFIYQLYQ